jgi:hypothetical protein
MQTATMRETRTLVLYNEYIIMIYKYGIIIIKKRNVAWFPLEQQHKSICKCRKKELSISGRNTQHLLWRRLCPSLMSHDVHKHPVVSSRSLSIACSPPRAQHSATCTLARSLATQTKRARSVGSR